MIYLHAGKFIFNADPDQKLKKSWAYPIKQLQEILSLDGEISMFISDDGAMKITVDSGLIPYDYILPAQAKMKILVTGHKGYIGSCLAPRLAEAGHKVVGLDLQCGQDVRTLPITDTYDLIIHLAGKPV